jgi:3-oxoacyl-[acyl-carrier-protein] synthase II
MNQAREVVITGVGMVCPIGVGREAFTRSLEAGQSGVVPLPEFYGSDIPYQIGGKTKDFDAKLYIQPRKSMKVMAYEIQAAYSAAALAIQDAKLDKGQVDPGRFGVVLGSELLYGDLNEMVPSSEKCLAEGGFNQRVWGQYGIPNLFPLWMLKYLPNMAACHIGIAHDARGHCNTIVEGEVSSLLAFIEAVDVIRRGIADVMIAGGCGSRITASAIPFRPFDRWTRSFDQPEKASRPFDAKRDGLVPGEGSGMLVLEAADHAERRGAPVVARVAGYARRFEQAVNREVTGKGIRASITGALADAGWKPEDVGHVNAHGASLVQHDAVEAQAISQTLGQAPVTAPKSFFGDLGASSGMVELAVSVLAVQSGRVPRTLNYETPDPKCPVNVVRGESLVVEKRTALALNQAETGHAVAVAIAGA